MNSTIYSFLFVFIFIEIRWIYNIVLISAVQESDQLYIYIHFFNLQDDFPKTFILYCSIVITNVVLVSVVQL